MEVEIFTLCDHAQDFNSKLVIVGTFDTIFSAQFPLTYSNFAIAGRLRFSNKEVGQHDFKIRLINAEGQEIIPNLEGNMGIQKNPLAEHSTVNFAINLNNLQFPQAGRYSVELYIDSEWKTGLPLILIKQQ
jgi:hypothetical protein